MSTNHNETKGRKLIDIPANAWSTNWDDYSATRYSATR
jgi:hypothetical protein